MKEHPANLELEATRIPEIQVDVPDNLPDNFVAEAMAKAYDPDTKTLRDLRVDDSALPLAKNFFHYCLTIVGGRVKMPFARQMWLAFHLLAEYCPTCSNPKFYNSLENIPVDMDTGDFSRYIVFLEHGICPKCEKTKYELIKSGLLDDKTELVMIAGQRAGKSTLTVTIVSYVLHVLLKSPRLSSLYQGIQDFSPLSAVMTATNATQAIKTLWTPFRNLVSESDWFKNYFSLMDDYKDKVGKELYRFDPGTGMYMQFFTKNLYLMSSGPNKRTLRGDTRFAAATDELGLFPFTPGVEEDEDDRERANADEVHASLSNSLVTVQGAVIACRERGINHLPQALNLNISSPFSWMDKICRLYIENADNSSVTRFKQPTWEITPLFPRDHPIIVKAYKSNSKKAERDFGANPPKIGSDFYQKDSVIKCFQLDNWAATSYEVDNEFTKAKVVFTKSVAKYHPCVLAIDAGSTNNAFALSVVYRLGGEVFVPLLIEVVAQPGKVIHFPTIYSQVILPILKQCNVKLMTADRWGSLQILQQAKDDVKDLKSVQYSVRMRDFENVVQLVENEAIFFPKIEIEPERVELVTNFKKELIQSPGAHLYLQCLTVQEMGGTVIKGSSPSGVGYTDDLHRSVVLGVSAVMSDKVSTYLSKFALRDRSADPTKTLVIMSGRSSFIQQRVNPMQVFRR